MKTGVKVTIGIIGIIAAGIIGFLISDYQLKVSKSGAEKTATAEEASAEASAEISNTPMTLVDESTPQLSSKKAAMDKDEKEKWKAVIKMRDKMKETPDAKAMALQSETSQTEYLHHVERIMETRKYYARRIRL